MALSRLRRPLISRAPSLLKARVLSSSSYASTRSLYGYLFYFLLFAGNELGAGHEPLSLGCLILLQ
ncbi:dihydrolipoyllysine-residue acetyltransferase component 1 of pyruvate dehydrogenase complex, mitochondrial [Senna tora]|uniref:Dihydrolipoyllysine-residue acetyltransferase component 1 of pyruvate dehydrogenase complex, mitochondrial n=1 Tax=Senna tora TaxID=362788 RepID=A0A834SXK6_9FABA|nr:dihydrolipoyllysine-residue acetyltransferase component 1 of pyruvate dehydrogenase complex, mitochondrial [Senna tora]